eukprot:1576489-Rhodomonas_salina.1
MRAIQCIGYDMDYTLIHYKVPPALPPSLPLPHARCLLLCFPASPLSAPSLSLSPSGSLTVALVEEWEGRAYHYAKEYLNKTCFNVEGLQFQPDLVCRSAALPPFRLRLGSAMLGAELTDRMLSSLA